MAVRTRRLCAVQGLTVAGTVVYTVPADRTAILKTWGVYNYSGALADFYVGVKVGGSAPILWFDGARAVPNFGTDIGWERFHVLHEGDQLVVSGPVASQFVGSGSLLLGDPS